MAALLDRWAAETPHRTRILTGINIALAIFMVLRLVAS